MKHTTVEDIIASFPHPILPTVQGEPYYQTIHTTRKLLHANARDIDTHSIGGYLGHLGITVSATAYTIVTPTYPWAIPFIQEKSPVDAIA
jgi:hypothetical protein